MLQGKPFKGSYPAGVVMLTNLFFLALLLGQSRKFSKIINEIMYSGRQTNRSTALIEERIGLARGPRFWI